jgi:hypothetical protein
MAQQLKVPKQKSPKVTGLLQQELTVLVSQEYRKIVVCSDLHLFQQLPVVQTDPSRVGHYRLEEAVVALQVSMLSH